MTQKRPMKKSESLEIRLSHPVKQAFMAHCQAEGRSASESLRGFIEAELDPTAGRRGGRLRNVAIAGLTAAALAAMAAPSLARPPAATRFETLDANHDGVVTAAEFLRLDTDRDGRVTLREFTQAGGRGGRP